MKREFLIEEIIFNNVSGEVRGTIEIDLQSGLIDHVDYESFSFRRDDIDCPTFLDKSQLAIARSIVGQLLDGASDVCDHSSQFVASAESFSPSSGAAASTQILAEYLEAAGRMKPQVGASRRAL